MGRLRNGLWSTGRQGRYGNTVDHENGIPAIALWHWALGSAAGRAGHTGGIAWHPGYRLGWLVAGRQGIAERARGRSLVDDIARLRVRACSERVKGDPRVRRRGMSEGQEDAPERAGLFALDVARDKGARVGERDDGPAFYDFALRGRWRASRTRGQGRTMRGAASVEETMLSSHWNWSAELWLRKPEKRGCTRSSGSSHARGQSSETPARAFMGTVASQDQIINKR